MAQNWRTLNNQICSRENHSGNAVFNIKTSLATPGLQAEDQNRKISISLVKESLRTSFPMFLGKCFRIEKRPMALRTQPEVMPTSGVLLKSSFFRLYWQGCEDVLSWTLRLPQQSSARNAHHQKLEYFSIGLPSYGKFRDTTIDKAARLDASKIKNGSEEERQPDRATAAAAPAELDERDNAESVDSVRQYC